MFNHLSPSLFALQSSASHDKTKTTLSEVHGGLLSRVMVHFTAIVKPKEKTHSQLFNTAKPGQKDHCHVQG